MVSEYRGFQNGPQANRVQPTLDPLDLPYPGAGFGLAVKRFYQNYAKFSGRASRSEFWWVQLFFILTSVVLAGGGIALGFTWGSTYIDGEAQPGPLFYPFVILLTLLNLASIIPMIALTVRRLHDGGFSGLWYLISFVPYIGSFVLLVFAVLPSKREGARFDKDGGQSSFAPIAQWAPITPAMPSAAAPARSPGYGFTPSYNQTYNQQAPAVPSHDPFSAYANLTPDTYVKQPVVRVQTPDQQQ